MLLWLLATAPVFDIIWKGEVLADLPHRLFSYPDGGRKTREDQGHQSDDDFAGDVEMYHLNLSSRM